MSEQERIEIILRLEHAIKQSDAPFVDRVPREVMLALLASNAALPTARAQLAVLAAEVIRHRKDRKEQGVPGMSIEMMATNADPALAAMIEGGG